jgi:hypothetical protein
MTFIWHVHILIRQLLLLLDTEIDHFKHRFIMSCLLIAKRTDSIVHFVLISSFSSITLFVHTIVLFLSILLLLFSFFFSSSSHFINIESTATSWLIYLSTRHLCVYRQKTTDLVFDAREPSAWHINNGLDMTEQKKAR